jgi:hypothetical protein
MTIASLVSCQSPESMSFASIKKDPFPIRWKDAAQVRIVDELTLMLAEQCWLFSHRQELHLLENEEV